MSEDGSDNVINGPGAHGRFDEAPDRSEDLFSDDGGQQADAQFSVGKLIEKAKLADAKWFRDHEPEGANEPLRTFSDRPKPDPELKAEDAEALNEIADKDGFVEEHLAHIRFCPQLGKNGTWFVWNGQVWEEDTTAAIKRLVESTVKRLSAAILTEAREASKELERERGCHPADKEAIKHWSGEYKRLMGQAKTLQTKNRMDNIEKLAATDARVLVSTDDLDCNKDILNCQNGIVDLTTGELLKHDPAEMCTRITTVEFDVELFNAIQSKRYDDPDLLFVLKVISRSLFDDAESVDYLRQAFGNGLYGGNRLERVYFCQGEGGDGKGVIFSGVLKALGDYAYTADFTAFVANSNPGAREDHASMQKSRARIVIAAEPERKLQMSTAILNRFSGNDQVRQRDLYESSTAKEASFTIFCEFNQDPKVDDRQGGFWRRNETIPFGPQLEDHERHWSVKEAFKDPKRGGRVLLAWLISGAVDTATVNEIPRPKRVAEAKQKYQDSQNPLFDFYLHWIRFADREVYKKTYVKHAGMAAAYDRYCEDNGITPRERLSSHKFNDRIRSFGCMANQSVKRQWNNQGTKNAKCWVGVTLADDLPFDVEDLVGWTKGSHVPNQAMHRKQLAGNQVTKSLVDPDAAHADEENSPHACARANESISSSVCENEKTGGNGNSVTDQPLDGGGDDWASDIDLAEMDGGDA